MMEQVQARGSDDSTTPIASGRLHAPGRHSHRLVALPRRLARRQLQSETPDPLRADFGARPLRRLVHGRPSVCAQQADGAFSGDVDDGIYFDPERLHVLDHQGEFLSVRGPLNIARPIQGWPVIVQAGASDAGRQLAAETAEMIFASGGKLADAQRYYT